MRLDSLSAGPNEPHQAIQSSRTLHHITSALLMLVSCASYSVSLLTVEAQFRGSCNRRPAAHAVSPFDGVRAVMNIAPTTSSRQKKV